MTQLGHNQPPLVDEERIAKMDSAIQKAIGQAQPWIEKGAIDSDDDAEILNDVLSQAKKVQKKVESTRKEEKEPHLENGRRVDALFKQKSAPLADAISAAGKVYAAYLKKKDDEARAAAAAEAARQAEEARKAQEAAQAEQDAIRKAEAETIAAERAKAAEEAKKEADNVKTTVVSATGIGRTTGLRTFYVADEITDIDAAFSALKSHPKISEVLLQIANSELRRKDGPREIAGFRITEDRRVA
ncbi:MAG: hypothetical protein AAFU68_02920 [Pseudomonadota bacterium]